MIKAPNWCGYAIPTVNGWVNPKSGEMLKSQKFTKKQVAEWHDAMNGVGDKRKTAKAVERYEEPVEEDFDEGEEE